MRWTPLNVKKHYGKTLPQVMFKDADWFFWAYGQSDFNWTIVPKHEVENIYKKACSIRIPQHGNEKLVAEYYMYSDTNKFSQLRAVPESKPPHLGSSIAIRSDHFDFSIVRNHFTYDKRGYELFVQDLKDYLFGDRSKTITKKFCEEFFNNDSNFDL